MTTWQSEMLSGWVQIHEFLGLTVGVVLNDMKPRRAS